MGYVFLSSDIELLKHPDQAVRKATIKNMLSGYESYKQGMRSGLFGLTIGRFIFLTPAPKDKNGN